MRKPILSILFSAVFAVTCFGLAQQINSFSVGGFTISVPPANPIVTVQSPARSGTMALKEDIVAGPASTEQRGETPLVNGTATVVLTGFTVKPFCVVSDPSGNSVRFIATATSLTLSGVGPSVIWSCK